MDAVSSQPTPLHEAAIATLRETADQYRNHRWAFGDLVTPKANVGMRHRYMPHVVIEVRDPEMPRSALCLKVLVDPTLANGSIRGLSGFRTGDIVAWWVEGWKFEPYTPDMEKLHRQQMKEDDE